VRGAPECRTQRLPAATPHVGHGTADNCLGVSLILLILPECDSPRRETVEFGTVPVLADTHSGGRYFAVSQESQLSADLSQAPGFNWVIQAGSDGERADQVSKSDGV
jgi:hypothetical protein